MKIIAMLSFFDEAPPLLRECIKRLTRVGVDLLVCVDGPYDLYPTEKLSSNFATVRSIIDLCGGNHQPDLILRNKTGWEGNEVEKRNYMLEVALSVAEEGDWLLVVDSDHMWEKWTELDLHDVFRQSEVKPPYQHQVAEVSFADCSVDEQSPNWYEARLLLRAVPGARYEGAHWRVRFPDGTAVATLKGGDGHIDVRAPILKLNQFFGVRHVKYQQSEAREKRQASYYDRRDEGEGIER